MYTKFGQHWPTTFREDAENMNFPYITPREAQKLTEFGKLRFSWSIQRSPERPHTIQLVRMFIRKINIGILIRFVVIQ